MGGFVLTAEHTHVCALCSADTPCNLEGCRATGLRCPTCESALEEVAALPAVRRPELSFSGAVELLELATRRACECAQGPRPDAAICILDAMLEHIAPVDPTSDVADTWLRLGVLVGGSDAWAKRMPRKHGDWPSARALFCYNLAYCAAAMVVQHVRSMEMKA